MAKYRENAKKAHAHAASEKQNLIPPSYAPSVPGVHAPSQKFDNSYNLPPNPGYGSDAYTSVVSKFISRYFPGGKIDKRGR